MPTYDGYTLADVRAAIEPGQPDGIGTAASAFAAVVTALSDLAEDVDLRVQDVTAGESGRWTGPAAAAFVEVIGGLVAEIEGLAGGYRPYRPALDPASTALTTAQTQLSAIVAPDPSLPSTPALEARIRQLDARARQILVTLAGAYTTAMAALTADEDDDLDATEDVTDEAIGTVGDGDPRLAGLEGVGVLGTGTLLAGLVPVDLGGGLGLALGSLDSTTYLAGLDPLPNPSLVLGRGTGSPPDLGPLSPVDTSLTGGGFVGPGAGLSPASHLTTATRGPAGTPAAASGPGGATRPPFLPPMPLGGVAPGAGTDRSSRAPLVGALGRPDDEKEKEARSSRVGDEEWDDSAGFSGAIGRQPASQPERG